MTGTLHGLRVVELAGLGPAPFAAMMLADHGAQVIRLHALAPRQGIPSVDTAGDVLARGRGSVALDLKSPEGRALALDLIAGADALIEGFRPGVAERLGLGPAPCLARNPRLAYGRMTGWGQTGPLAPRAGHDINYIALTGALAAIGPTERPVLPLNLLGEFAGGGMMLAFGLLAAVIHARTTGQGQVIDAAMTDGASLLTAMIHGFRGAGAWSNAREANLLDGGAWFYSLYPCADGKHLAVGCIEPQFRAAFLHTLGLTDLGPDPRATLTALFATEPRDHWAALFDGTDACVTPVLDWDEAQAHPHNLARAGFATVAGVPQPNPAPRFSASPAPPLSPPGLPDPATLSLWGIAPDRIAALTASGVIASWPQPESPHAQPATH